MRRDFYFSRKPPRLFQNNSEYFLTFNSFNGLRLNYQARQIVFDSIIYLTKKLKLELFSFVIMLDHVHILVGCQAAKDISVLLQRMKSYTSHKIKGMCKIDTPVWRLGTYDRVVRNDRELIEFENYIIYNPVKAGYVDEPEKWEHLYVAK